MVVVFLSKLIPTTRRPKLWYLVAQTIDIRNTWASLKRNKGLTKFELRTYMYVPAFAQIQYKLNIYPDQYYWHWCLGLLWDWPVLRVFESLIWCVFAFATCRLSWRKKDMSVKQKLAIYADHKNQYQCQNIAAVALILQQWFWISDARSTCEAWVAALAASDWLPFWGTVAPGELNLEAILSAKSGLLSELVMCCIILSSSTVTERTYREKLPSTHLK